MKLNSRVQFLIACACLAGCAKPVAPVTARSGAESLSGARAAREGAASHTFDVRLKIVGDIVTLDRAFQPVVDRNQVFYVSPLAPGETGVDTVPAFAVLRQIQWKPATAAQASVSLDAEGLTAADPTSSDASAAARDSTQVFAPGFHELTLQAPDRAGGGTATVRFFAGFAPATWWAGPDPGLWPGSSDGDGRAVDVTDWSTFSTVPAWPPDGRGYFGPDSFRTLPSQRRPVNNDFGRRTFYEIYGNRIYARSEGDTVHMNAWIVICNGGYDKDSPYLPRVVASDPGLPPGYASSPDLYAALLPQGLVGSPIGFRSQLAMKLPDGTILRTAQTGLYPTFDPASVFRLPQMVGYWPSLFAGKAYLVVRAQDADGLLDAAIVDPVGLADLVDAGGGTPADRLERRKILTFYVRAATRPELARGAMPEGSSTNAGARN